MGLDNSKNGSIIRDDIKDLKNLKQRSTMTYEIIGTEELSTGLRRRMAPSALELALEIRKLREEASVILQAKHLAGKELAHGAIAYLFGAADTHQIEFPVGHQDVDSANKARRLHDGYRAHLDFLSSQGVITPHEVDGLFIAYGTGRIIQRIESDLDDFGSPAVIAYRDSESQRILDCMTD
jgi:hypothetical protein